jgi:hypothetical protein
MKKYINAASLVLSVSIVAILLFSPNAKASSFGSGTTTIDWGSLQITMDSGMSLNWLSKSDQTYAFATIGATTTNDSDGPISPWGAVSSQATLNDGNQYANANGSTNANTVGMLYDGHVLSSGSNVENATAARYGIFKITGSGDVTFSAPYHIDYTLTTDGGSDWARAANLASLYAKNYVAGDTYGDDGSYDYREQTVSGGADASLIVNGTLHVTLHFEEGQTGFFMAGVGDLGKLTEWVPLSAPPVPEPSLMLLLGIGLVGVAGLGRKFKK